MKKFIIFKVGDKYVLQGIYTADSAEKAWDEFAEHKRIDRRKIMPGEYEIFESTKSTTKYIQRKGA